MGLWEELARAASCCSEIGRTVVGLQSEGDQDHLLEALSDVFSDRATAAIARRGSALIRYLRRATSSWSGSPFPVQEGAAYAYVGDLRRHGAPATRANSFIEALNFAKHVAGFEGLEAAISSRRLKGAAHSLFLTKRLLKQRAPFKAAHVEALELLVMSERADRDRIFAGFVAFMAHARLRFGDALAIQDEPVVEGDFVEAGSAGGKTANRRGGC